MRFDHVLLIGFGGPRRPEEIRPFLERVTGGARIPEARLQEVARHYEATGGSSPYNPLAMKLSEKLEQEMAGQGASLPVFVGMRNWHPLLSDALRAVRGRGLRQGIGVVLAPHRSEASFDRYLASLEEALRETSAGLFYEPLGPWYDHPFFIEAQAGRVLEVWNGQEAGAPSRVHLLFTAHSIPLEMARRCRYEEEVRISSRMIAERLGVGDWSVAYQSRSGPPGQPWLEPDVLSAARDLARQGVETLGVVPVGFLFDHTEVLYDLDVELRSAAEEVSLRFLRAPTVMDHPKFVEMLSALIRARAGADRNGDGR